MPGKKIRRVMNARKLTAQEAAEYRGLREQVEKDKAEILAEGRRLLSGKWRSQAALAGTETLGQKIRQARELHGWSQAELARRARLTQSYLCYLEQDEREPSLSIAARLARELEIPLEELAVAVR